MRSVFVRVFLWFWLAMAVVAAVLVVSSPFFTRSRPRIEQWQGDAEDWGRRRIEHQAEIFAQGGLETMRGRHHGGPPGHGHGPPGELYVFDREIHDKHGQRADSAVRRFAQRVWRSGTVEVERSGSRYLFGSPAQAPDGEEVVLVNALQQPPRLVDLLEPGQLLPRLVALLIVAGAFCYWLARYLSSPIRALQAATRSLASGDLTARVGDPVARRRDEVGDLARDVDAMADRLAGLIASQQRLVRDVSHELRSPLARLGVAVELARQHSEGQVHGFLDRIERESRRLDTLIEQLLTLSRIEAGVEEKTEQLDLVGVLTEVVGDVEIEAAERPCSLRLEAPERCLSLGVRSLLESAVENIVRNAIRYTEQGSEVEIEATCTGEEMRIAVRDHGPGVPEEDLEHLFEPFYRVEDARDRRSGGIGLGLAIAARAIALHQGATTAANHPQGGLVVEIVIPTQAGLG
jgi:signal transduction histidine kinase